MPKIGFPSGETFQLFEGSDPEKPHVHMLENDKQSVESPLVEAFIGGYIRGLMNIK